MEINLKLMICKTLIKIDNNLVKMFNKKYKGVISSMSNNKGSKQVNKSKEFLVACKRHQDYEIFDHRALKPICVKSGDASMVLQELHHIDFNVKVSGKKNILSYFAPNNVGILLSISSKSIHRAREIYENHLNPDKFDHTWGYDGDKRGVVIDKSKCIYDFIEEIQSSIVFGYTALEAFTNLSIQDDYQYKIKNHKGITEVYDKEAIERWMQLSTKISGILVDIYETKNINQGKIWSDFKQFEEYRNEIVHQKSINHTSFYKKYFKKNFFKILETPEEIIKFFFKEKKNKDMTNPLWPWIINDINEFPVSYDYKSDNFEVTGNIFEARK